MPWDVTLAKSASRTLDKLPRGIWPRMERAIDELARDPAHGDVLPLKGRTEEYGVASTTNNRHHCRMAGLRRWRRRAFQRGPVPVAEGGGGGVGALAEIQ